jgi:hypothetical protein
VRPREILKLIWSESVCVPRLRRITAFRRIITELDLSPPEDPGAEALLDEESPEVQDRRRVHEVLARGAALDGAGLRQVFDDTLFGKARFEPPLVLVVGELELPFDEVETLKATMTALAPLSAVDKKLKEALDAASELLKAPSLQASGGIARGALERLREAFAQARHGLPPDYVDASTERILLQERRYQKRPVFGQSSIRGLLHVAEATQGASGSKPAGSAVPIPTYLPESLTSSLPMFRRFKVRLLAEADLREDQYEVCPMALRALALGRVMDR